MNANVLKSKSLFCLDASYAPLHIPGYAGIRWNIVGGDACAHKRIKGWDKGRYTHTRTTRMRTQKHTHTHFLSLSLFPPLLSRVIFSRLYLYSLSPNYPFARPVVPAVSSPSTLFVKFVCRSNRYFR